MKSGKQAIVSLKTPPPGNSGWVVGPALPGRRPRYGSELFLGKWP